MEYRTLGRTGVELSTLGFGGAPLGDEYGSITAEQGTRAFHCALDAGINFVDVAPYYGRTLAEERLGSALQGRRDGVFLATKCARFGKSDFDFSAARVATSVEESLARLRTDRIDLLQVHDVEFGHREEILAETLPALQSLKDAGKVRFIGITGLPVHVLQEIAAEFPVDSVLSYCHYNLMVADFVDVLGPLAAEQNLGLINASPLHMGILSESGPQAWHPAPEEVKQTGRRVAALCREHGTDVARVSLRFCLDQAALASTLVGMRTEDEVRANLRALDEANDPALLAKIAALVAPVRNWTWHEGLPENAPELRPS